MTPEPFVHLRVRSHYSLLRGGSTVEALVQAAVRAGHGAMALTDHRSVHGVAEAEKICKKSGISLVVGCVLPVQRGSLLWSPTVLVRDRAGWTALCRLLSGVAVDTQEPLPVEALLSLPREHVFVLAGPAGRFFHLERDPVEVQVIEQVARAFGDALFIELCDTQPAHRDAIPRAVEASERLGVGRVVVNDVHAATVDDLVALDVMRRVATKGRLHDGICRVTDQDIYVPRASLEALFPQEADALDRTVAIASQCDLRLASKAFYFPKSDPPEEADPDGRWAFLVGWFPAPAGFEAPPSREEALEEERRAQGEVLEGLTELQLYFGWFSRAGLRMRLARAPSLDAERYGARLEDEIRQIRAMGFSAYMLIVAEFTCWAKDNAVPVGPGRGSVAGSLVAWAMRITDVDSIRFELYFERFLNPARVSMPDVDTDFGVHDRDRVIAHVIERYGSDRVGQISTYGTLAVKGAVKDVCRVLSVHPLDAEEMTRTIDTLGVEDVASWVAHAGSQARRRVDPLARRIMDLAALLEGKVRQVGVHAAGVVVTPRPATDWVPVYHDAESGQQVLGTNMDGVDAMGLVKFDFLGLENLDILRSALDLIERRTGARIDLEALPFDDPAVLALLCRGESLGLFQVESDGMRQLLRRIEPSSIEDLIALLALYRPGPLATGMVDDYIERKHGRAVVETLDPRLTEVLRSTYGVFVYQEQVMRAAQVLAGYSLAEADLLRRAIAKKKPEEMAEQRRRFLEGCEAGGMAVAVAEALFAQIEGFAEYCFNRSHSASYAIICWWTAVLKAHHECEYMAAFLTAKRGNVDAIAPVVHELSRHGIRVLTPDLWRSEIACSVEDLPPAPPPLADDGEEPVDGPPTPTRAIRLGLCMIRGLGPAMVEALSALDRAALPRSQTDVIRALRAIGLTKTALVSLAAAGALDSIGDRASVVARIEQMATESASVSPQQVGLFSAALLKEAPPLPARWSWRQRMEMETRALGVSISGHLLDRYGSLPVQIATHRVGQVPLLRRAESATLVGVVTRIHRVEGRRRDLVYVTLSEPTGVLEVVLRDGVDPALLEPGRAVRVRGALDRAGEEGRFIVEDIDDLDAFRERAATRVDIRVPLDHLPALSPSLREALDAHPGRASVRVLAEAPDRRVVLEVATSVAPSDAFFTTLEGILPNALGASVVL